MDYLTSYSPVGDLSTLMICIILIVSLFESFVNRTKSFRIFFIALVTTAINAISMVALYVLLQEQNPNMYLVFVFRTLYRLGMVTILECYIIYVLELIEIRGQHFFYGSLAINLSFCMLDSIWPIWNPNEVFNPFTLPIFLAYCYSIGLCVILLLRFKKRIISQIGSALVFSAFFALVVIWREYIHGNNSFLTSTFLYPILVVMFLAHANPYDMRTGALDFDSFIYYLQKEKKNRGRSALACLKFYGDSEFVMPEELQVVMRNFWSSQFRDAKLFNPVANMFILAIKDNDAIDGMKELFLQKFTDYYDKYQLDYKALVIPQIDAFSTFMDVNETFDFLSKNVGINEFKVFSMEDMKKLNRGFAILNQVRDIYNQFDLDDPRVIAYYQPIKNLETGKYDTAESLMRLQIEELGMAFPDEFIPLIEKADYMHTFSMIMLNKVCKDLKKLHDIKRISVNFSISELKHENFVEDFENIVQMNGIPYEQIGVEFTENMNDSEFGVIKQVVLSLRELGCVVYLDDFGTGYNNFDRVLGLNMNVIKFDRSLLLLTKDDIKAKYIIDAFSATFAKMGFKILYEGVETEEQEQLCMESHANYLQGFKYSKPIDLLTYQKFLGQKIE